MRPRDEGGVAEERHPADGDAGHGEIVDRLQQRQLGARDDVGELRRQHAAAWSLSSAMTAARTSGGGMVTPWQWPLSSVQRSGSARS